MMIPELKLFAVTKSAAGARQRHDKSDCPQLVDPHAQIGNQNRQKQNQGNLDNLGRLELERSQAQPALLTMRCHAQRCKTRQKQRHV